MSYNQISKSQGISCDETLFLSYQKVPKVKMLVLIQRKVISIDEKTLHQGNFRGCSIITSRIGSGLVSAFFVMLRDGKQGGEWYFVKGCNVMVKKNHKAFFLYYCEEIWISLIWSINGRFTCTEMPRSIDLNAGDALIRTGLSYPKLPFFRST